MPEINLNLIINDRSDTTLVTIHSGPYSFIEVKNTFLEHCLIELKMLQMNRDKPSHLQQLAGMILVSMYEHKIGKVK
jgi:hypothetical protein